MLKQIVEKYLKGIFKKEKFIFDKNLDIKQDGVEVYGKNSMLVLVKKQNDNVSYNVILK